MIEPLPQHEKNWRLGHWLSAILAVACVQAVVLALLSERRSGSGPKPFIPIRAKLIADPRDTQAWISGLAIKSASVFAQVHPMGFSGRAWLQDWRAQYTFREWSEPPRWLDYRGEFLADSEPLPETASEPLLLANKPVSYGATATPYSDNLSGRSTVQIVGELSQRLRTTSRELPGWAHTDVLTNSILEILVNNAGDTISARLVLPGSGLKEADDYALRWARRARYRPINLVSEAPPDFTPGRIIFHWHTQPAGVTGQLPIKTHLE